MPKPDDMTTPVTRHDLEEILASYATRAELEELLANLPTHAQLEELLANHPTHAQLEEIFDRRFALQRTEIASTMTSLLEDAFKRFRVIDDQYKDLPGRVAKLERAVFPPPRARRKRAG